MIDFSNCPIDTTANYGGSDQKRGIIYNGKQYMLKIMYLIGGKHATVL